MRRCRNSGTCCRMKTGGAPGTLPWSWPARATFRKPTACTAACMLRCSPGQGFFLHDDFLPVFLPQLHVCVPDNKQAGQVKGNGRDLVPDQAAEIGRRQAYRKREEEAEG